MCLSTALLKFSLLLLLPYKGWVYYCTVSWSTPSRRQLLSGVQIQQANWLRYCAVATPWCACTIPKPLPEWVLASSHTCQKPNELPEGASVGSLALHISNVCCVLLHLRGGVLWFVLHLFCLWSINIIWLYPKLKGPILDLRHSTEKNANKAFQGGSPGYLFSWAKELETSVCRSRSLKTPFIFSCETQPWPNKVCTHQRCVRWLCFAVKLAILPSQVQTVGSTCQGNVG